MFSSARTPLRTHRLRPLNLPRSVLVELNERQLPVAIRKPMLDWHPGAPEPGSATGRTDRLERRFVRLEVESIREIWRVDDEWWRTPVCRRYIDVILQGGKHTVLFQDLTTDQWFEQLI